MDANNDTRATMEALVFKGVDGKSVMSFIECNRRPQVENETLALLQRMLMEIAETPTFCLFDYFDNQCVDFLSLGAAEIIPSLINQIVELFGQH